MLEELALKLKYKDATDAQKDLMVASDKLKMCAKVIRAAKDSRIRNNIEASVETADVPIENVIEQINKMARTLDAVAHSLGKGIADIRKEQERLANEF